MTTVVGIRCKDGIVIGSDSQGTLDNPGCSLGIKLPFKKVFQIKNSPIIFAGAGDGQENTNFLKFLKVEKLDSEENFKNELKESVCNFLNPVLPCNHLPPSAIDTSHYARNLDIVLGARMDKNIYLLFHIYYNIQSHGIDVIDVPYYAIGSGSYYSHLLIKQQRRIFDLENTNIDTAIGIMLYVIEEAKHIDSKSSGDTQIAVVSQKMEGLICPCDFSNYYENMIDSLSASLDFGNLENKTTKQKLKKMFPISKETNY